MAEGRLTGGQATVPSLRGAAFCCAHTCERTRVCVFSSLRGLCSCSSLFIFSFDLVSAFSSRASSLRDASFVTCALEFHTLKST